MLKIITGVQCGNERKEAVTSYESLNARAVVRCAEVNSEEHTILVKGQRYTVNLLPSSITNPEVCSIIAPDVPINPKVLLEEIESMRQKGVKITPENLAISQKAHVIMPWHIMLDEIRELIRGDKSRGTVSNGVEPCCEENCRHTGIRMIDLLSEEDFREKIEDSLKMNEIILCAYSRIVDVQEILETYLEYGKVLAPFIKNTTEMLKKMMKDSKNKIILVGNQACTGAEIGPTYVDEVIGVMKAYTSKIGEGPFPTEENNEIGNLIREAGHEHSNITKRLVWCGWLDLVMVRDEVFKKGVKCLAINNLDAIGKLKKVQLCIAYRRKSELLNTVPADIENCQPMYKTFFAGWDASECKTWGEIPDRARSFVQEIENFVKVPVKYIGIGPENSRVIIRPTR